MPHKSLMTLIILGLGVCIVVLGCKVSEPSDSQIPIEIEKLLSAPERIEIYGRNFVMQTYLWRDFMPGEHIEGSSLYAVIKVIATDTLEFPSSIDADKLWVIKDRKEVWETGFLKVSREPHRNYLQKMAVNGPKWGPFIYVDVVVRIVDREKNNVYFLKASNQWIHRTD